MDESIIYLKERFALPEVDIQTYSPLILAYIGDAAYELIIRTYLVDQGNGRPDRLHRKASSMVKASAQAAMAEALLPLMTGEEEQVYRRGRNAKSVTMAKNATMSDYRKATGFEALMGYLYLKGEQKRMVDLVYEGLRGHGFLGSQTEGKPER
ncbi:MAG: ribonuclease III domain-containing protein [Lachnospiraceae bacterium]|nr:ribonuclease III domain-containing protein [Lachnospiraceae bacterium]